MAIILSPSVPATGFYARYDRADAMLSDGRCVDLWSIWRANEDRWLADLAVSHDQLNRQMAERSRWWWATTCSRLDARPWGQSGLIKPLMFAHAVASWMSQQAKDGSLVLVDCPSVIAVYLSEFGFAVSGAKSVPIPSVAAVCLRAVRSSLRTLWLLFRWHVCRAAPALREAEVLAVYELRAIDTLSSGHAFAYAGLFDELRQRRIVYVAAGVIPGRKRQESGPAAPSTIVVLDHLRLGNLINVALVAIAYVRNVLSMAQRSQGCNVSGRTSHRFWREFLLVQIDAGEMIQAYCAYLMLLRVLHESKPCMAVLTHEERGVERALLLACKDADVPTIGHMFHPQHHFLLALHDRVGALSPKPNRYSVCGTNYREMLVLRAGKPRSSIAVWGSAKSYVGTNREEPSMTYRASSSGPLSVLLVLSHPTELEIFHAWMRIEPNLGQVARFLVRRYRTVQPEIFDEPFSKLQSEFASVVEVGGDIDDNVAAADVVAFCATSAGPEAVNLGRVGIFCELNDFFCIDPLFGDLDPWLSCPDPHALLQRLNVFCELNATQRMDLLVRQQEAARRIFSPISSSEISEALEC